MKSLKETLIGMNLSGKIEKALLFLLNLFSNYSTEEKVIGTWIDGKTIYRKVIPFSVTTIPAPKTITHSLSIETYLKAEIVNVIPDLPTNRMSISSLSSLSEYKSLLNVYYEWAIDTRKNYIMIENISCSIEGIVFYLILEYTKTNEI